MARQAVFTVIVDFEDDVRDTEINDFQSVLENEVVKANLGLDDCFWKSDEEETSLCEHQWKLIGYAKDDTAFHKCTICGMESES